MLSRPREVNPGRQKICPVIINSFAIVASLAVSIVLGLSDALRAGQMDQIKLDQLDINLLKYCEEKRSHQQAEIITPFLGFRKERTLYERLKRLESAKLIRIDRSKERGRALCFIEPAGKEILGHEEADHPKQGGPSL